jgi:hypothetical protein
MHQIKRGAQFGDHDVDIQGFFSGRIAPFHLAIDAVEITALVGVHVDPDGEPFGAGRDHKVNKVVVQKIPEATEGGFRRVTAPGKERGQGGHWIKQTVHE